MHKRAAIVGLSTLWLVTANCGEPFAIVAGGGGGAGGAGGAGATTGTGGTTTTPGTKQGDKCSAAGADPCDAGLYCRTKDCKTGTCEQLPTAEGQAWNPVCGCDGTLYWNADLAIASDVAFQLTTECDQNKLVTCSPTSNPCAHDDNVYCNLHAGGTSSACTPPKGYCTKLPETCEGTTLAGLACFAPTAACERVCELMKSEKTWFTPSPTCTP